MRENNLKSATRIHRYVIIHICIIRITLNHQAIVKSRGSQ